jgi:hypothetical protein
MMNGKLSISLSHLSFYFLSSWRTNSVIAAIPKPIAKMLHPARI